MLILGVDMGATFWSRPVAANQAGEIILWKMDDFNYEVFALVYKPGFGVYDLNDVLVAELDWRIQEPA